MTYQNKFLFLLIQAKIRGRKIVSMIHTTNEEKN